MADTVIDSFLRDQLTDRRQRLEAAAASSPGGGDLLRLLAEVDAALERMEEGTYGICEVCHESVEKERLIADPLMRFCLDHLTRDQQSALEQDLRLASQLQRGLLPKQSLRHRGWELHYSYRPLGPVSGDYCDVVIPEPGADDFFFFLGDVSGKGVTASMLMTHVHAIFRTLIPTGLPLSAMVGRAGRILCESAHSPYFATLVCAKADASGRIELCNAGHCPPLWLRKGEVTTLDATGMPLGMFCDGGYSARTFELEPGDSLFLYTDGLSEARNGADAEYGESRLSELLSGCACHAAEALVDACLEDLGTFLAGAPLTDDLTVMAIRRAA